MIKKGSKYFFLALLLIFLISCNPFSDSQDIVSSSGPTALYKAAIGALYHTDEDYFENDIDICNLTLNHDEINKKLELTLNNCSINMKYVDFLMVNGDQLEEETDIIYPHYGLDFSEEFINLVPSSQEGLHELKLTMDLVNDNVPTILVLLSYFVERNNRDYREEHYIKYESIQ